MSKTHFMRRWGAGLVAGVLLSVSQPAWAACTATYEGQALIRDMQTAQMSLRAMEETTFKTATSSIQTNLPCLASPVPASVFATVYRYMGVSQYLQGDTDGARRWFRTALDLDPSFEWDAAELELSSPIRKVFEEERTQGTFTPVPVEGKDLDIPTGTSFYLDGKPLMQAAATQDRPHVLQHVTADRKVLKTWLIDGNAFPQEILKDKAAAPVATATKPPKGSKGNKGDSPATTTSTSPDGVQRVTVERPRPPEKIPLIVAGVASVLGSGATYYLAMQANNDFSAATTTAALDDARAQSNQFVFLSAGLLAVGAGVGTWGVVVEGPAAPWALTVGAGD